MKDRLTMTKALRDAMNAENAPSVNQIAKETGLNRRALDRFKAGETGMQLSKADVLAEYLGVQVKAPKRKRGK